LFFPVGTSGPALAQTKEAKAVCHRCPVASKCLAWALESGVDDGVFGGLDEHERRTLKLRVVA
jgi:WhiB family redox-sensing transcriptional regulator